MTEDPEDGGGRALLPCPMCGDRMRIRFHTIKHREPGDCLIGPMGWDETWADRWNRRAPGKKPGEPDFWQQADGSWMPRFVRDEREEIKG